MAQLDPSRYRRLGQPYDYSSSDGVYYDTTNGTVVIVKAGTVLLTVTSDGTTVDFEFSSEARGDIIRRNASTWGRYAAATTGQVLAGDGTDIISAPVTGDVGVAASGGNLVSTVVNVTQASQAAGDLLYKATASTLTRLAKGTAGQVLAMNAGATAPQWTEVNGSVAAKPRLRCISETLTAASLTDGGAAVGTKNLTAAIPAGARFLYTTIDTIVGFAGDVSAVITLGDGSDVDRYNTGTPNIFATAAAGVDMGVASGTAFHATAVNNIVATVTSSADITPVLAGGGSCSLKFWFLEPV